MEACQVAQVVNDHMKKANIIIDIKQLFNKNQLRRKDLVRFKFIPSNKNSDFNVVKEL